MCSRFDVLGEAGVADDRDRPLEVAADDDYRFILGRPRQNHRLGVAVRVDEEIVPDRPSGVEANVAEIIAAVEETGLEMPQRFRLVARLGKLFGTAADVEPQFFEQFAAWAGRIEAHGANEGAAILDEVSDRLSLLRRVFPQRGEGDQEPGAGRAVRESTRASTA